MIKIVQRNFEWEENCAQEPWHTTSEGSNQSKMCKRNERYGRDMPSGGRPENRVFPFRIGNWGSGLKRLGVVRWFGATC